MYRILLDDYKIDRLRIDFDAPGGSDQVDIRKIMFMDDQIYHSDELPQNIWGYTAIWFDELRTIKSKVENIAKREFNVCVCIYYPDGNSGVDFHSDFIAFGDTRLIPSLSIGEEREFHLREKESRDIYKIVLENGSLLIMGENCQERYEHSLPINPKYKNGRINLTFRPFGF